MLVFSAYNDNGVQDYRFCCHYIPKQMINLKEGAGYTILLGSNTFDSFGAKYLYISNTTIRGHKNNSSTGTGSGINYHNNKFVMRYVIGV